MGGLILVTGGAGFIGSHLVDALLTAGHDVRVLDDFSTGKKENLRGAEALAAAHGGHFQLIAGDVRSEVKMRDAVDGCAAVCHLAAVASVTQSLADPVGTGSVTHGGTVNAVRMAIDADVPRFVLASSCAVYGDAARLPVAEASAPHPLSPYAEAKLAAEETCAAAADAGQLTAVCLRFFNVYGPRQDPGSEYSGVISRFMAAASAGAPVTVYGDGRQTRDFVYVGDVVEALVRALQRPHSGVATLNVGSGTPTSMLDVLGRLEELAGGPIERRFEEARSGDIRESRADARRAEWVLGWVAGETLAGGLKKTWAWYQERSHD
ncbi:MAG: NAD-dependent epimerase/dehydratase family protein [Actinobacteria bacterium]|nr:NAD-dependent epimerase/dehydratase family protein [Actinomycetota bacterium]